MANPLIRIEAEEGFLFFYFLVSVIFFERIQIWPWLLKQSALYWLDTYLRLFMEMLSDF